jgi:hypothetical protein
MLRLTVHLHIEYLYVLVIIVEWGRSRVPVQAPLAYLRDRGGMSIEMCLAAFKALGERWDARKCVIAWDWAVRCNEHKDQFVRRSLAHRLGSVRVFK